MSFFLTRTLGRFRCSVSSILLLDNYVGSMKEESRDTRRHLSSRVESSRLESHHMATSRIRRWHLSSRVTSHGDLSHQAAAPVESSHITWRPLASGGGTCVESHNRATSRITAEPVESSHITRPSSKSSTKWAFLPLGRFF